MWLVSLVLTFQNGLAADLPRTSPNVPIERVVLPLGANRTLNIKGLRRAALVNPKVARARTAPPHQLLITAKAKGKTWLRTWSHDGSERVYSIEVVPAHLAEGVESSAVKVALQFLELDASGRRETGVRWPELLSATGSGVLAGTGSGAALSYTVGLASTRGWLQQLVREGHAKLLANPELYVRLGEEASFSSGGELPVPTTSENFGRTQKHVEWKPFGMLVKVKPESADTYHLHSDVFAELSEVNASNAIDGIPALNRRKLTTKVNSLDGETVLLSGLVRQLQSFQDEGMPVLKDIPILGGLFSSRTRTHESQEILMAMTLSVVTRSDSLDRWESFEERFKHEVVP